MPLPTRPGGSARLPLLVRAPVFSSMSIFLSHCSEFHGKNVPWEGSSPYSLVLYTCCAIHRTVLEYGSPRLDSAFEFNEVRS